MLSVLGVTRLYEIDPKPFNHWNQPFISNYPLKSSSNEAAQLPEFPKFVKLGENFAQIAWSALNPLDGASVLSSGLGTLGVQANPGACDRIGDSWNKTRVDRMCCFERLQWSGVRTRPSGPMWRRLYQWPLHLPLESGLVARYSAGPTSRQFRMVSLRQEARERRIISKCETFH
jgi:hypothetical protein